MADPRNPERPADDASDTSGLPDPARTADVSGVPGEEHTFVRSERISAESREETEGGNRPGGSAGRGNLRGALDEMNREAGGVGGGLANLAGGRMLPLVLLVVAVIVVLIILASIL